MRKRVLTKQVAVVLSEETYQRLIEITDEMEVPVSEFIRKIIEVKINPIKGEEKDE